MDRRLLPFMRVMLSDKFFYNLGPENIDVSSLWAFASETQNKNIYKPWTTRLTTAYKHSYFR